MAPSPDVVEDLITRAVQELEQRGEPGLQEFLTHNATHAAEVRDGLERLRRLGILAPPPAAPAERTQFGEFKVLRRIGAGGMGVVYAAEQTSLQRTVALKVVRPEFLLSTTARERFHREVEAVARLAHPGIVPILAVGNEETQPWFAMEYVEGQSLEQLLAGLGGQDPARADGKALGSRLAGTPVPGSGSATTFAGSYWEACVRVVLQVAQAMAYVHERGIVHRDLKPSNIVVTPQGQARVLDFGLAHVRDLQRVTREDRPLGSPAYVAPEQLRGEAIDERVDIYGLGVTLYELLTRRLPFPQETWPALQQAILAGNPRPVRAWNRAVPRDLEIVCMVALDRDRARRYRSMADFAADLEAVLARRPILARPLGPALRLLRCVQRHPTLAVAGTALLLVALQFPLVLWRQEAAANEKLAAVNGDLARANGALAHSNDELAGANEKLARTNSELAQQRAAAVANYDAALEAVEQVLISGAQHDALTTPGAERMQLALLRRAEAMYEQLRRKRPGSRRVEFDSARNLQHIGTQLGRLGDHDGAEASYRTALARIAPWTGADFQYLRGCLWRMLYIALGRRGDRAGAEQAAVLASCELEGAALQFPGDRVVLRQAAEAVAALGNLRARRDPTAARELLLRAQALKDELYRAWPEDMGGAIAFAYGCSHLADLRDTDGGATAEQWATRGIEVLSAFTPHGQEEGTLRSLLAGLYDSRAVIRHGQRRFDEAEPDHGHALALRAGLAHDYPRVVQYRFETACSLNNLAMVRRDRGDVADAAALYGAAVADFQQAVTSAPTNVEFAAGLVTARINRCETLNELAELDALGRELPDLFAVAKTPAARLQSARLALRLAAALATREAEHDAEAVSAWRDRAAETVAAVVADGFTDRAHFESSRLAPVYDDIRSHPRFQAAMARLAGDR